MKNSRNGQSTEHAPYLQGIDGSELDTYSRRAVLTPRCRFWAGEGIRPGHPATAHDFVNVDKGGQQCGPHLGGGEFGGKQLRLGGEHREVWRIAPVVLQPGQAVLFPERPHQRFMGLQMVRELLAVNEGIFHIAEGAQDRIFVALKSRLLHGFGLLHQAGDGSPRENRPRKGPGITPDPCRSSEEVGELGAGYPSRQ